MTADPRAGRRAAVTAVSVFVVAVVAGVGAAAFWRTSGEGSRSTVSDVATSVTLTAGTVTSTLRPGGASDVSVVLANAEGASTRVPMLALDTAQGTEGFTVDDAHRACTTSSFAFTSPAGGVTGWTVPASSTRAVTLPGALSMAASAPNACQGVLVTVHLKATAP
jgi:hypothetical protein